MMTPANANHNSLHRIICSNSFLCNNKFQGGKKTVDMFNRVEKIADIFFYKVISLTEDFWLYGQLWMIAIS